MSRKTNNMLTQEFLDEPEMDICDNLFDHIDDFFDFSHEDIVGGDCDGFKDAWPAPILEDDLTGSISLFSNGNLTTGTSELPTELHVPCEDIPELEWLSNFVEDSFSAGSITLDNENCSDNNNDSHQFQFQTSSPVSVLESSSSCSGVNINVCPEPVVRGRARSKRPRPATFNPRPMIPINSPSSSITGPSPPFSPSELLSDFDNFADSHRETKLLKPIGTEQKTKKKIKILPPHPSALKQSPSSHPVTVRKCLHCEITKTPQWRAGPMGPKSLCNACGVRYKSGRLFPEYRPAASPTFVSSLHSSSHKKVLEMRNKSGQKTGAVSTVVKPKPDFST